MSVSKERKLPRESDGWFEAHLEKLRNNKRWLEIPGLEYASTPDETVFFDDISDGDQFNTCYIESRVRMGGLRSIMKLIVGMFLAFLLLVVGDSFNKGVSFDDWGVWIMVSALFFYGLLVWAGLRKAGPNVIRFNRQAQLVHIVLSPSFKVVTIPWREVKPFIHFQRDLWGSYNLTLLFPYREPKSRKKTRNFPIRVTGGFSSTDWVAAYTAIMRWEFIRLYMEKGLDAIPISEEARNEGRLVKPSGKPRDDEPDFNKDPISYIWRVWLYRILVFPWLVDRILDKREADFRWPEEVEKLCKEGADLSGIDATPVVARTDEYYYVTPMGAPRFGTRQELRQFRIAELRELGLDPDGNPIPGSVAEQRMLEEEETKKKDKEARSKAEQSASAWENASRPQRKP